MPGSEPSRTRPPSRAGTHQESRPSSPPCPDKSRLTTTRQNSRWDAKPHGGPDNGARIRYAVHRGWHQGAVFGQQMVPRVPAARHRQGLAHTDRTEPFSEYAPELGPCWIWTAGKNGMGYGAFHPGYPRQVSAHRWAYELLVGPIPPGLQLDHLCRVPSCVNPRHLEPVTPKVNLNRGYNSNQKKTQCPQGHPYDDLNTSVKWRGEHRFRRCRICTKSKAAARWRARKG